MDQYRILLIHLMNGGLFKDNDPRFIQTFLFGSSDIQTWMYLKLCSFKYVREGNYEESFDIKEPRQN